MWKVDHDVKLFEKVISQVWAKKYGCDDYVVMYDCTVFGKNSLYPL